MIAFAYGAFGGVVAHCRIRACLAFELALFDGVVVAALDTMKASDACVGGMLETPAFLALRRLTTYLGFFDKPGVSVEAHLAAPCTEEVVVCREGFVDHNEERGSSARCRQKLLHQFRFRHELWFGDNVVLFKDVIRLLEFSGEFVRGEWLSRHWVMDGDGRNDNFEPF